MNVALVGATDDKSKYAYLAFEKLRAHGHRVFPVNPSLKEIEGVPVYASAADIPEPIDTTTLYVSAKVSAKMADAILANPPRRLIFNPGAENAELARRAEEKGVKTLEACTLVMLSADTFDR